MINLLPIYFKDTVIDPLKRGANNGYEFGMYYNDTNVLPTFITEERECTSEPHIDTYELRLLNREDLKKGIMTVEATFAQEIASLTKTYTSKNDKNFYKISLNDPTPAIDLTVGSGIFQIYILLDSGDYWYSDLFALLGFPSPVYNCSNADFDEVTSVFTLDIDRTDNEPNADPNSIVVITLYNSDNGQNVASKAFPVNIAIGGSTFQLSWNISALTQPFDFFVWSGACSGSLEIEVYQFEDGTTAQLEGNYFILTTNS